MTGRARQLRRAVSEPCYHDGRHLVPNVLGFGAQLLLNVRYSYCRRCDHWVG